MGKKGKPAAKAKKKAKTGKSANKISPDGSPTHAEVWSSADRWLGFDYCAVRLGGCVPQICPSWTR